MPAWAGPPGWLAQIVAVLATCLVTILGLGIVHLFSLVPTTLVLAGVGVGMYVAPRLASEPETRNRSNAAPERLGRAGQVVAIVAVAIFAATWGARVYVALSHGMVSIDSLWYHLPQAARFAHEHSVTGIHHDVDNLSGFYPINAELMHSLGMVLLGTDSISMVLTTIWGAVALLAGMVHRASPRHGDRVRRRCGRVVVCTRHRRDTARCRAQRHRRDHPSPDIGRVARHGRTHQAHPESGRDRAGRGADRLRRGNQVDPCAGLDRHDDRGDRLASSWAASSFVGALACGRRRARFVQLRAQSREGREPGPQHGSQVRPHWMGSEGTGARRNRVPDPIHVGRSSVARLVRPWFEPVLRLRVVGRGRGDRGRA